MSADAKYFVFLRSEIDGCRVKNPELEFNLAWRLRCMAEHFISGGMISFPAWCL